MTTRRALAALLLASLASSSWAPDAASEGTGEEYRLGAEDVIRIQAWGRADLMTDVALDESGRISVPLVGTVDANGQTPAELARQLTERFQLIDSRITEIIVTIVAHNSRNITIVGEVRSPGRFGFRTIPDLWEILLRAGGTTPQADLAQVQVVRSGVADSTERRIVTIDLSRGIERTDAKTLPTLHPKDTIIVPSITEGALPGDKFQILGAVRSPGTYKMQAAATVIEAISAAGGELPDADLSKTRLTRLTAHGSLAYTLDVRSYLDAGRPETNLALKPGDTISIPRKASGVRGALEGVLRLVPIVSLATSIVSIVVASK